MRVLVTGAAGLLGRALLEAGPERGHDVRGTARAEMDVTDAERVREVLAEAAPEAVIHAAGYTDVDAAEDHPDEAFRVNRDGTENVARAAADLGALLVYTSTDYVFGGERAEPYPPEAEPDPRSVYGRSKLAGEAAVRALGDGGLVARSSWLYGAGGDNFVDTMLALAEEREELRVVDDQRGRPTWTRSLARALYELMEKGARGIFHVCDAGVATWHELAVEALRIRGVECRIRAVGTQEWGARAHRPRSSVLDLGKTRELLGRELPHWKDSLRRYLTGGEAEGHR